MEFDLMPELMGDICQLLNQRRRIEAVKLLRQRTKVLPFSPCLVASKRVCDAIEKGAWSYLPTYDENGVLDWDNVFYRVSVK